MSGRLEFTDRFRIPGPSAGAGTRPIPAWVCNLCPNVLFVRAEHQPAAVRAVAHEVRTRANRDVMKSRFVRGKATRALQKSQVRKKGR
jgi:hypothetical protein